MERDYDGSNIINFPTESILGVQSNFAVDIFHAPILGSSNVRVIIKIDPQEEEKYRNDPDTVEPSLRVMFDSISRKT